MPLEGLVLVAPACNPSTWESGEKKEMKTVCFQEGEIMACWGGRKVGEACEQR